MRIAITGIGAVSPFGLGVAPLWDGLRAGGTAVTRIAELAAGGLPVTTGGEVPFGPEIGARDVAMSQHPIAEALAQSGRAAADTAVIWANGLNTYVHERGELVERSAGACFDAIARHHAAPRRMIATACASSTQSIGEAFRLVRAGRVRACVAGGATTMLTPHYALGFAWLQALAVDRSEEAPGAACKPFDRERRGFALAEGGGALVLEPLEVAQARGARVLAEVVGFGSSQDAFDLNRPPGDGAGAELCMRRALADAELAPDRVTAISAHGTGTRAGDPAEASAVQRVLAARWRETPVTSIKGALGHAMAAAGALQAVAAVRSLQTGILPPTCNLREPDDDCVLDHVVGSARELDVPIVLVNSFGMGGQNACAIYARAGAQTR